jgi:hypothetical protein
MDPARALAVADNHNQILATVTGKPASLSLGQIVPSTFGASSLNLLPNRVVERSRYLVAERESEIPLSDIDSVELTTKGNPILLMAGILMLAVFGLGLVLIALYFFVGKHRFLVIRSRNNAQITCVTGDEAPFRAFMQQVMAAALAAKGQA